jgi:hypothetical protein
MDIKEFLDKCLNKEQIQDLLEEYRLKVSGTKDELIDRLLSESDFDTLVDDIYGYLHEEEMKEICKDLGLVTLDLEEDFDLKEKLWGRIMVFTNNFERGFGRWTHFHKDPIGGLSAMAIGMFLFIIALGIIYLTPQPVYNGDLNAYMDAIKIYADTVKIGGYLAIFGFLIFGFGSIWGLETLGKKRFYFK